MDNNDDTFCEEEDNGADRDDETFCKEEDNGADRDDETFCEEEDNGGDHDDQTLCEEVDVAFDRSDQLNNGNHDPLSILTMERILQQEEARLQHMTRTSTHAQMPWAFLSENISIGAENAPILITSLQKAASAAIWSLDTCRRVYHHQASRINKKCKTWAYLVGHGNETTTSVYICYDHSLNLLLCASK